MQTASSNNAQKGVTVNSHSFTPNGAIGTSRGERSQQKTEWKTDKVFTDTASGLAVEVQRLPLQRPKFSILIGQVRDGGGVGRFVRPNTTVENAKVNVTKNGMTLARLYDEALLYVEGELQSIEDDYILRKQLREQRQIDRETGKENVVQTGKTAREAAKRARHENNLAERRATDAARTSMTKGKSK